MADVRNWLAGWWAFRNWLRAAGAKVFARSRRLFHGVRAERREEQVPKLSKFKLDGDEIVASVDGAALA